MEWLAQKTMQVFHKLLRILEEECRHRMERLAQKDNPSVAFSVVEEKCRHRLTGIKTKMKVLYKVLSIHVVWEEC